MFCMAQSVKQNVLINRNLTAKTTRLSIMEALYIQRSPLSYAACCTSLKLCLSVEESATVQAAHAGVTVVTDSKLWTQRSR